MVEGVRDGDSRDPWPDLDAPVGDRLDWGAIGGPLVPVPRPRRRRARATTTAVLALITAACAAVWLTSPPGEPLGRPATAPAGHGGYAFLDERSDGRPVTFDPCEPVHVVVRPEGQPPSGPAVLAAALDEVSRATGLVFVDDGLTSEAPSAERHLADRWSLRSTPQPVLVAWATEDEWPALAGSVVGEAGPVSKAFAGSAPRFVTGQVVLDAADLAHAPGDAQAAEQVRLVVLHELGHLVGLGHVDDPTQLMHAETAPGLAGFGPGDLRGLHLLGSGECA